MNSSRSVTVEGDKLIFMAPDCSQIDSTFFDLTDEQRTLLASVMDPFLECKNMYEDPVFVAEFDADQPVYMHAAYPLQGKAKANIFRGQGRTYYEKKISDNNFSIGLKFVDESQVHLSRVFFIEDTLTFVHSDRRIKMQPKKCINADEHFLLREIESDRRDSELEKREAKLQEKLRKYADLLTDMQQMQ